MAQVSSKHLGKSKYKGVYIIDQNQTIQYKAYMTINGKTLRKIFNSDTEAAKCIDMFLIRNGKNPVNIIKRK